MTRDLTQFEIAILKLKLNDGWSYNPRIVDGLIELGNGEEATRKLPYELLMSSDIDVIREEHTLAL